MSEALRAGIIGSGFAAKFHYEAIRRIYSTPVKVSGAYSRNKEKLQAFVNATGINGFQTLDALIEESDMLHVCTPPSTHEDLVVKVLAKGKSVIVEKPFTGYFGDGTPAFDGDRFPRYRQNAAGRKGKFRFHYVRRKLDLRACRSEGEGSD
jgi:predicted dehydrogenase